jgi:hypothetical protein
MTYQLSDSLRILRVVIVQCGISAAYALHDGLGFQVFTKSSTGFILVIEWTEVFTFPCCKVPTTRNDKKTIGAEVSYCFRVILPHLVLILPTGSSAD